MAGRYQKILMISVMVHRMGEMQNQHWENRRMFDGYESNTRTCSTVPLKSTSMKMPRPWWHIRSPLFPGPPTISSLLILSLLDNIFAALSRFDLATCHILILPFRHFWFCWPIWPFGHDWFCLHLTVFIRVTTYYNQKQLSCVLLEVFFRAKHKPAHLVTTNVWIGTIFRHPCYGKSLGWPSNTAVLSLHTPIVYLSLVL